MAYLSLARFAGDPDALLATYTRAEPTMRTVGRDHGLSMHAAARTDCSAHLNLWPSSEDSRRASEDPRRLAVLRASAVAPERIQYEHHELDHYAMLAR